MARLANWQNLYNEAVMAARNLPFKWGEHDCVMFASRVVDSFTDLGTEARMRAKYQWSTAAEAQQIIEAAGGLVPLVTEILGASVGVVECSKGDVLVAQAPNGEELVAVHDGGGFLLGPAPRGIRHIPLRAALYGWRI